jgi:transcriptional regulator with XRE-family HTH domain
MVFMKKQRSLSNFLKEKRVGKGLTQADLAKALGYTTPQFVSNWENERSSPPLDAVAKLVDILDIQKDEIITIMLDETRQTLESHLSKRRQVRASYRR